MRSHVLANLCPCALTQLEKFVDLFHFAACTLVVSNYEANELQYLVVLLTLVNKFKKIVLVLFFSFLFVCVMSVFHLTVACSKISYTCSVCCLGFCWSKCCQALLRVFVLIYCSRSITLLLKPPITYSSVNQVEKNGAETGGLRNSPLHLKIKL